MSNFSNIRIIDVTGSMNVVGSTLINKYSAMSLPAYRQGVRSLAENLAGFPRSVRKGDVVDDAHPLNVLLRRRPNDYQNPFVFWRTLFAHLEHHANGYAWVKRSKTNAPASLHNLLPCDVTPFRFTADGEDTPLQFYKVEGRDGVLPGSDVIHLQGLGYDGMMGADPVALHDPTFQHAATLARFQTRYLQTGTNVRGTLEYPVGVELDDDKMDEIQDHLRRNYNGDEASRDIAIFDRGGTLKNTTLNAQQSQLVEQGAYTTKQIAQILNIPPELLFERSESKYTGVEEVGENFVRYCLRPRIEQIEAELSMKLLTASEQDAGYHVHLNPDALLRGDTEAVNASAVTTKTAGIRTANEARALVNLPPIAGPDGNTLKSAGDTSPQPARTSPTP